MVATARESRQFEKLTGSLRRFGAAYWTVPTKSQGYAPFVFRPAQRLLYAAILRQMRERGFVRLNVLKCRQVTCTSFCTRYMMHSVFRVPALTCLTIAHDERLPSQWLVRCRENYDQTPWDMRPAAESSQGFQMRFANGSRYYIGSAQGGFPAVGDTVHRLHLSELGRWDKPPISVDPLAVLAPLQPAIPSGADRVGTVIIRESTGVTRGDYWHGLWLEGKSAAQEYRNLFLPWYLVAGYRRDDLAAQVGGWTEYERSVSIIALERHRVRLSDAQVAWRRNELSQSPWFGNEALFNAEYPATEDEAFCSPGATVFTAEQIARARATVRPPVWRGALLSGVRPERFNLLPSSVGGELWIWEKPKEGFHYAIGADCQWGKGTTSDFDAADVECLETGKIAARWWGRRDMGAWALLLASLGHYYNVACLGPERNSRAAEGVILPLLGLAGNDWNYPNLYIRDPLKRWGVRQAQDFGFLTDEHTKPGLIVSAMQQLTPPREMDWADEGAVDEMGAYIRNERNELSAPKGQNDDRLMARLITAEVARSARANLPGAAEPDPYAGMSDFQRRALEHAAAKNAEDAASLRPVGDNY